MEIEKNKWTLLFFLTCQWPSDKCETDHFPAKSAPKIPEFSFFFFTYIFLSLTVAILYTWAERGTVRIKCLAQECSQHNVTLQPGLGPGALDLETSALTTVPHGDNTVYFKQSNILW